jgi:ACT domain-containing protein
VKLREDDIRRITLNAIQELGENATPDLVRNVVTKAVDNFEKSSSTNGIEKDSGKIILTSFGSNHPGIVAAISNVLSDTNSNILDISQKILTEYYTMIMVIDITASKYSLKEIQDKLHAIADKMGIKIYLQHEDIFRSMHRI